MISVLGSANLDLVVHQPRRAEPGETLAGTGFASGPGGKGLNQAVAAARAGADVAFLGAIGADAFGARLRTFLLAERIDVERLRTVSGPTGVAQVSVTDDAENSIVVVAGANGDERFDDADRAAIAASSHLLVQLERPLPLLEEALRHARAVGAVTVVTPAPVVEGARRLIPLADVLVPNEQEALALSGADDAESAARELSIDAGLVIVTLGARGVLLARSGAVIGRVAAMPVRAVDTTGAGDTFVGVLTAWLASEQPLDAAVIAASAAAALAFTRPGAAEAAPLHREIERVLDQRGASAADGTGALTAA